MQLTGHYYYHIINAEIIYLSRLVQTSHGDVGVREEGAAQLPSGTCSNMKVTPDPNTQQSGRRAPCSRTQTRREADRARSVMNYGILKLTKNYHSYAI